MDNLYLHKALQLAKSRQGYTSPNPAVAAIIVVAGKIISYGVHQAAGEDHAEVVAIKRANKNLLAAATLYVTLEPCTHYGKTPPCTAAIITSGIKRVIYGCVDPNSIVTNTAKQVLAKHQVVCEFLYLEAIDRFYNYYRYWCLNKLSWLSTKIAISNNRVYCGANYEPLSITSSVANYWTQQQRLKHDAILTTARIINNDNPCLNIRYGMHNIAKPLIVLTTNGDIDFNANCFQLSREVLIVHSQPLISKHINSNYQLLNIKYELTDRLFWQQLLKFTAGLGYHSVWAELGACSLLEVLRLNVSQVHYEIIAKHDLLGKIINYDQYLAGDKILDKLDVDQLIVYNLHRFFKE